MVKIVALSEVLISRFFLFFCRNLIFRKMEILSWYVLIVFACCYFTVTQYNVHLKCHINSVFLDSRVSDKKSIGHVIKLIGFLTSYHILVFYSILCPGIQQCISSKSSLGSPSGRV